MTTTEDEQADILRRLELAVQVALRDMEDTDEIVDDLVVVCSTRSPANLDSRDFAVATILGPHTSQLTALGLLRWGEEQILADEDD